MSQLNSPPLGPSVRADLEWSHHADEARWVALDPLAMRFYCFSELERATVQLLSGHLSLSQIAQHLQHLYPAVTIDGQWLRAFLSRLQQHHLLQPQSQADSARMARATLRATEPGLFKQLLSPLSIRIPVLDPSWLLNWLRPVASLLFHPLIVLFWLVAGCVMGLLVLRALLLAGWQNTLSGAALLGDRWWYLAACYVVAKSLHELGHGLACVRYRAHCRELGVMFLCLAPCLYCDTTDAWKLSSKWERAAIAAAGMWVEWILATLAAGVWLITQDGTLHYVAASMMLVCSLGTVLVNSNPLLKYDGYYLLSDLWGVPNLSEQGSDALRGLLISALSGRSLKEWHFDASIGGLALYALGAIVYRSFILLAIVWLLWSWLVPLGLGFVSLLLIGSLVLGLLLSCSRWLRRLWRETRVAGALRVGRWLAFFSLISVLVYGAVAMPIPQVLRVRGVTDYRDKLPLFASQTAELTFAAPLGERIEPGAKLLEFRADDSEYEWVELRGQIALAEQVLSQLQTRSAVDPATAYLIPTKTEELQQLQAHQRVLQREREGLVHVAAQSGYLLPGPIRLAAPLTAPRDDSWVRHALQPELLGSTCQRGELVGWFSTSQNNDPQTLIVTTVVPQQEIKRLMVGMSAAIQWDGQVNDIGRGKITRIAPEALGETPRELIGDAYLHSLRDERGVFVPEQPHYEVSLAVESAGRRLCGAPATVQFELPQQTLWQRAVHILQQNLKPLAQ